MFDFIFLDLIATKSLIRFRRKGLHQIKKDEKFFDKFRQRKNQIYNREKKTYFDDGA